MAQEKRPFVELIRSIYLYLFTAVGLILIIVGIFQISNYIIKITAFDKYQLGYEESKCDYITEPVALDQKSVSTEEAKLKNDKCLQGLEELRRYKKITDGARAITFLLVGGGVFWFHLTRSNLLSKKDRS